MIEQCQRKVRELEAEAAATGDLGSKAGANLEGNEGNVG